MPSPVAIDPEAIASLRSLNPGDHDEFLRELIGIFVEDVPKRIAELEQSLAAGDAARFTRAAHSIKGGSSNLGAAALRDAAAQLELRSKQEGLAGVAPLLASLKVECTRAQSELAKLVST